MLVVQQMQEVQSDYEKRLKEVEHREEKLLREMEARENGLLIKNKNLEDDARILQQQLKNLQSTHQEVVDINTKLNKLNERYKLIEKNLREDIKELRKSVAEMSDEKEGLVIQVRQLTEQAERFSDVQHNYTSLYETNTSLKTQCEELQGRLESVVIEKEELEKLNQDITDALNEERESKEVLEMKLREGSYQLPQVSWEDEGQTLDRETNQSSEKDEDVVSTVQIVHSTPIPNKANTSSLFTEFQTTLGPDKALELEELKVSNEQAKQRIAVLLDEKSTLEEKITLLSTEEAKAEAIRNENIDTLTEKEKMLQELKEDIENKNTLLEKFQQQSKVDGAEKTSLEIKVEILTNELQNVKENHHNMIEMKDKEISKLDLALQELHEHKAALEEDLNNAKAESDQLSSVLGNSHSELSSLVGHLKNLKKAVETLQQDVDQPKSSQGQPDLVPKSDLEQPSSKGTTLRIKSNKAIEIDEEKQCFTVIATFRELIQSLRVPIDNYTRIMLSRSLHNSNKDPQAASTSFVLAERNAEIARLKNRITHKSDELYNLRIIMKARQTTAEVGLKTLQSQLESERARYEGELSKLKYDVKELNRKVTELKTFKMLYLQRFEEHINEISRLKRELDRLSVREEETNVLLEKTIQRKLELTQVLEDYEIRNETLYIIPQRMESSRI